MTPEDLIQRLAEEAPSFEIDPMWLPEDNDGATLSYFIVSDLRDWLMERIAAGDVAATRPAFALIEDGFVRGDDDVRNLLSIELFEGVEWTAEAIDAMLPKTRHEHEAFALADAADGGRITDEQLEGVARKLRRGIALEPHLDVRAGLYVLARAGAKQHRTLVESYLNDPDPRIAVEALRVLCVYWDETDLYADAVIGVLRDGGEEARCEAAFFAGRHLHGRRHPALLEELLRIAGDADEDAPVRDAAHEALGRAVRAPESGREERVRRARALLTQD